MKAILLRTLVVLVILGVVVGGVWLASRPSRPEQMCATEDAFCQAALQIEAQLGYMDVLWIRRTTSADGTQILTVGVTIDQRLLVYTPEDQEALGNVMVAALDPLAEGVTVLIMWVDFLPLEDDTWDKVQVCSAVGPLRPGDSVLDGLVQCLEENNLQIGNPDDVYLWPGREVESFPGYRPLPSE